jgi:cyanate permease
MKSDSGYSYLMLALGWLIYFSFGLINTAIAPLVSPIMRDLNLTYTQMGIITGAWQLLYIFSAQPLGMIIDRFGVFRSLFLGSLIVSISALMRFFVTGFVDLFASVALFGLGGPLISIGTPKLIAIWFRGRSRGTASGINASGSVMGSVAALSLTNNLLLPLAGSWRNVFLTYAILGFSIASIWYLLGRRIPLIEEDHEGASDDVSNQTSVRDLIRRRDILLIVSIGVVFFLVAHGLQNWLPRILELKGFNPAWASFTASLMMVSGIFGSLIVPRTSYLMKSRKLMIALVLLLSGGSILLVGTCRGLLLLLGISMAGFFTRSLIPLLTLTLMNMPDVGSRHMGTIGGLLYSVGEIGGFLGPFIMGYLKDVTGTFFTGLLFFAVVTELSIVIVAFLKTDN